MSARVFHAPSLATRDQRTLYAAATGSQAAEAAAPAALIVTSLTIATPTPMHTAVSARARAVESVCP
jgi:hypothetical protein